MPNLTDKLILWIEIAGCPNRCRHCYWSGGERRKEMTTEEIMEIVEQFRSLRLIIVIKFRQTISQNFRQKNIWRW